MLLPSAATIMYVAVCLCRVFFSRNHYCVHAFSCKDVSLHACLIPGEYLPTFRLMASNNALPPTLFVRLCSSIRAVVNPLIYRPVRRPLDVGQSVGRSLAPLFPAEPSPGEIVGIWSSFLVRGSHAPYTLSALLHAVNRVA